jgi:hypothetical protein
LLFCARTASVIHTFRAEQPELAGIARAFSMTPPNARVLAGDRIARRRTAGETIRSLLGVRNRRTGWFSTYLLTIKNVTTVQVKSNLARPEGFWDLNYARRSRLGEGRGDYDYVWAFHVPQYKEDLDEIGEEIYESGDLRLSNQEGSSEGGR